MLISAIRGLVILLLALVGAYFGAAGTLDDGRGWAMLALFFAWCGAITVWLWLRDQALLERRVNGGPVSEPDRVQNLLRGLAGLVFLGVFVVPGLDRRFGWSNVPDVAVIVGNALVAIGFWIVFLTFRANSFAAATVEVMAGQRVIDRGPYGIVRHPMYAGALVMFPGMPLALGSWWGLVPAALIVPILMWRLAREEALLVTGLPGYDDYRRRVRYRLVPWIW